MVEVLIHCLLQLCMLLMNKECKGFVEFQNAAKFLVSFLVEF